MTKYCPLENILFQANTALILTLPAEHLTIMTGTTFKVSK